MEENDESTVEKFIKIQIKQPREKQFSVLFVSRFVSGTQRGDKLTTSSERVDPGTERRVRITPGWAIRFQLDIIRWRSDLKYSYEGLVHLTSVRNKEYIYEVAVLLITKVKNFTLLLEGTLIIIFVDYVCKLCSLPCMSEVSCIMRVCVSDTVTILQKVDYHKIAPRFTYMTWRFFLLSTFVSCMY